MERLQHGRACWQLTENDVSPIFTPLYHAGGLGAFLTPIILAGGTIVLHREFDAAEVWRTIENEGCTVVLGVPTIWKMLADAPEFETADLSHVRWFISGGAPLPRHLIEVFRERGIVMRQGYGLTEVGVNCFAMSDEEAWQKAGSIGRPLMFTEAQVVDADGKEMPADEVGELCFRGPHVSAGYWKNPRGDRRSHATNTGGFTPATWRGATPTASSTSPGAPRTCSSPAASTSTRRRSRTCSCSTRILRMSLWSGVPHPTWGEVGVAFVVAAEGKRGDRRRTVGDSWTRGWRDTRSPRSSIRSTSYREPPTAKSSRESWSSGGTHEKNENRNEELGMHRNSEFGIRNSVPNSRSHPADRDSGNPESEIEIEI